MAVVIPGRYRHARRRRQQVTFIVIQYLFSSINDIVEGAYAPSPRVHSLLRELPRFYQPVEYCKAKSYATLNTRSVV